MPRVGKKTAQRMILELKEKIDQEALIGQDSRESDNILIDQQNEVVEALIALGYQAQEAKRALDSIEDKDQDVSTLVRLALKLMDRG